MFSKQQKLENEIIWQIPEYVYRQKGVSWQWISLIIAIILIAFATWQKNFLFAVFIAIAFFMVNYLRSSFPPIWRFKIDKKGLSIQTSSEETKKFYSFEHIEGFDIHSVFPETSALSKTDEEYKELVLKIKGKTSPFLKINIYTEDEEDISKFLSQFSLKEEYPQSFAESLGKMIGF
ncbi:hypothetical protein HZB04_00760 [Candidatus Wolfebacteria bacterium]|nr:hypothetical protein [Candidatus Wolfebacteria bacterium]